MKDHVFSVIGVPDTIARIRHFREVAEDAAERGLIKAAEMLLEQSNLICPIDTGYLRESGHVVVEGKGFKTKAYIVYDAEYAIYVHERLDLFHEEPTQAKFLEETMKRYRKDALKMVKMEVNKAVSSARFWKGVRTSIRRTFTKGVSSISGGVGKRLKSQTKALRKRIKKIGRTKIKPGKILKAASKIVRPFMKG